MNNGTRRKGKEEYSWRKTIIWSPVILLVIFLLGFFTPFLFMAGPLFGMVYVFKERGIDPNAPGIKGKTVILPALRGAIIGTFMALAVLVPFRTVVTGLIWLSGWENLQESLKEISIGGFVDAWFGICGLSFAIIGGMMAWTKSLRLKSQIENLPTSTVRSAAIGLSELKGIARPIEDEGKRLAETLIDGKKKENRKSIRSKQRILKKEDVLSGGKQEPILSEIFNLHSQVSTTLHSRFYLEDETGKILVDPRGIDFWDGHGHFLWKPIRSIYLETRHSIDSNRETRCLLPGDPVYIIGSIEENTEAGQDASELDRLILKPSSSLKSPGLFKRIMLGEDKKTRGTDIYDVFFLSDLTEFKVKDRITQGVRGIWKWILAYVVFSVPLVLIYGHRLFDLNAAKRIILFLPGGKLIYYSLKTIVGLIL